MEGANDIQRSLGRIEGKLDMTLDKIIVLEKKHEVHGQRMSSLESTRAYIYGVIAAVATVFGIIGSFIGKTLAATGSIH